MTATTESSRHRRDTRCAPLPGIVVQDRDRAILTACYEYRHLTRSQLQRLFAMPSTTGINGRLRKLFLHRYLDRRFSAENPQASEGLYFLGVNGIPVVAERLQHSTNDVAAIRRKFLELSPYTLAHDTSVNDFRIAVTLQCRHLPDCTLMNWRDPFSCEQEFETRIAGKTVVTSIRPDGFFQLGFHGRRFSFCLEVDRSTCSHKRLAAKFQAYADFFAAGLQEAAFGAKTVYVLVTTNSARRRDELKTLAEKLSAKNFFFAALPEVTTGPLTAQSWYRASETSSRPLLGGQAS